jgi:hypothetical protein
MVPLAFTCPCWFVPLSHVQMSTFIAGLVRRGRWIVTSCSTEQAVSEAVVDAVGEGPSEEPAASAKVGEAMREYFRYQPVAGARTDPANHLVARLG